MSLTCTKRKYLSLLDSVLHESFYLATRNEEEDSVTIYHLGGFFMEVYYDPKINHVHQCFCFTSMKGLSRYIPCVQLTELE